MEKKLFNKRKNYSKFQLLKNQIKPHPMDMFNDWYLEISKNEEDQEINAMVLSTIENFKSPRSRIVLLKKYSYKGFYFFTNYNSRKGFFINQNPEVSLHFYWEKFERQVIIQAKSEKTSSFFSDLYFQNRPRNNQLSAIISPQSKEIPNRDFLDNLYDKNKNKFKNQIQLKRPNYWGGYLAIPYEIEFWQGRPNRLHDRFLYSLNSDNSLWNIKRLAP